MTQVSRLAKTMRPSATVGIADTAMELRRKGVSVVDLSAGRAAEHTPDYVCEAAIQAIRRGETHQTHGQGTPAFREACASMLRNIHGLDADPEKEIIATMGIKQALSLAFMTLLNPGDEVLVEDPCFVSYEPLINVAGGKAVYVPLLAENRFRWTRKLLEAAITPKTKAILLNSPHNPTGVVHTLEDLNLIADVARQHQLIVITDEIYERVVWGGRKHISLVTLPGMRERTWTIQGLTKTFAMGGWRVGFIYAPAEIIEVMVEVQRHLLTCVNSFVQAGAAEAFGTPPSPELRALWQDWETRCAWFAAELDAMPGISCAAPEGGFYAWADISALKRPSVEVTHNLLWNHHVATVPGSAFGAHGEGYLRCTAVRSWDELREGIVRIRKYVDSL